MTTNARTYQIIIGVLVLVIIVLAWRLAVSSPSAAAGGAMATSTSMTVGASTTQSESGGTSSSPAAAPSSTSAVQVEPGTQQSVTVANQPAGDSVMVGSVTLSQTGWVAIRDSSGRTLGAGRFGAGTHTGVSVPLLRATEAGQTYQALLYVDTGDTGVFDLHADTLITNPDGSVAGTTFTAQ